MTKPENNNPLTHKPNTEYTDEQKRIMAIHYASTGSLKRVADATGYPLTSIGYTRDNWDEWEDVVEQVRSERSQQHIALYNDLIDAAQAKALELLPECKSAREAALVAAISQDKSLVLQGRPNTISSNAQSMNQLAQQFRELSAQFADKSLRMVNKGDAIEND